MSVIDVMFLFSCMCAEIKRNQMSGRLDVSVNGCMFVNVTANCVRKKKERFVTKPFRIVEFDLKAIRSGAVRKTACVCGWNVCGQMKKTWM